MTGGDQARAEGAELRELLAKATPGPWEAEAGGSEGYYLFGPRGLDERFPSRRFRTAAVTWGSWEQDKANAALIVAAVNALPGLLDRLERVEALAVEFESNIDWSSGRWDYGDNEAWESAARQLRAALLPSPSPQQPDGHDHTRESEDQG